jgi:hypothetical protein
MQEHSLNIHETNQLPIVDFPRGEELIQKSYLNLSISNNDIFSINYGTLLSVCAYFTIV